MGVRTGVRSYEAVVWNNRRPSEAVTFGTGFDAAKSTSHTTMTASVGSFIVRGCRAGRFRFVNRFPFLSSTELI